MGGGNRSEEEWERIFAMKRRMSDMMAEHTIANVMKRDRSPYITGQATEGNRHQRRAQARKAKR